MKRYQKHCSFLLATLALFAFIAAGVWGNNQQQVAATGAPVPDGNLQAAIAALDEAQRETLRRFPRVDSFLPDVNGTAAYVFGDLGPIQGSTAARALEFLKQAKPLLKSQGNDAYEHISTETDQIGQAHYRFQQHLNGLPVKGAVMIVHVEQATGMIVGLNGHIAAGEAEEKPRLSAPAALAVAIEALRSRSENQSQTASFIEAQPLTEPTLAYVLTPEGSARLAWRAACKFESETGAETGTLYADANSGELVLHEKQVFNLLKREIYDFTKPQQVLDGFPNIGTLIFKEGGDLSSADAETKEVYPKLKTIYDYLKSRFNRNSFDGLDTPMRASIHVYNGGCAAWWDVPNQAVFLQNGWGGHGDTTKSLDSQAHEFGHGVVISSACLYGNSNIILEAGFLSEAFPDIMGACVEAYAKSYSGGAPPNDPNYLKVWSIGEDFWKDPDNLGRPLRSFSNPKSCDNGSYQYVDYYPDLTQGGVDGNEGGMVACLAFCLLAEGGKHPRQATNVQVYKLGIPKAEQIFYRALTAYLTPFATFADTRICTIQAARDLYGAEGFEQAQVANCWDAVGVPYASSPLPFQVHFLSNGGYMDPSVDKPGWQYAALVVPSGQGKLEVIASNALGWGTGNADIYLKRGIAPTMTNYDRASEGPGITKTIRVNDPQPGTWYAGVHVRDPYGSSRLQMLYSRSSGLVTLNQRNEIQVNDSTSKATVLFSSNTRVIGRLYKKVDPVTGLTTFVDNDFFKMTVPAGKTVFITMNCPPFYQYQPSLLDRNGTVLAVAEYMGKDLGKYKTLAFNNNQSTAKLFFIKVEPLGKWMGKIWKPYLLDPAKDYYLDITW